MKSLSSQFPSYSLWAILASLCHVNTSHSSDKDTLFKKRTGFGQSEDYEIFTTVSTGNMMQLDSCEVLMMLKKILLVCRDCPKLLGQQTLQFRVEIRRHRVRKQRALGCSKSHCDLSVIPCTKLPQIVLV